MAQPTQDAISFIEGSLTVYTWSHTCSGVNRALFVEVNQWINIGETISSVTYAAAACSLEVASATAADGHKSHIYSKSAPATGANNIVVTFSDASTAQIEGVSFNGVNQADVANNGTSNTGATTAVSTTVTSGVGNLVLDTVGWWDAGLGAPTIGGGQTLIYDRHASGGTSGCGSREAGAASVVMSWTLAAATSWAQAAVSILGSADATDYGRMPSIRVLQ
jgi:hypothetical protein